MSRTRREARALFGSRAACRYPPATWAPEGAPGRRCHRTASSWPTNPPPRTSRTTTPTARPTSSSRRRPPSRPTLRVSETRAHSPANGASEAPAISGKVGTDIWVVSYTSGAPEPRLRRHQRCRRCVRDRRARPGHGRQHADVLAGSADGDRRISLSPAGQQLTTRAAHPRFPPTAPASSSSARSLTSGGVSGEGIVEAAAARQGGIGRAHADADRPEHGPRSRAERHHRPHHRRRSRRLRTSSRSSATPRCRSSTAARTSSAPSVPAGLGRAAARPAGRRRWVPANRSAGSVSPTSPVR